MSNEFKNSDVIIIGGGLAGPTTAALLVSSGKAVTLFEHSSREIGGRARTAEIDINQGPDTKIAENLYIVGDWIGKEGIVSNASVASAKRPSQQILDG